MRNKITDILYKLDMGYIDTQCQPAADIIIAALPDMIAPLVFKKHPIGWSTDGFMIDTRGTSIYVMRGLYGKTCFDTVDDAIKACNTRHRAVIMAAFNQSKEDV